MFLLSAAAVCIVALALRKAQLSSSAVLVAGPITAGSTDSSDAGNSRSPWPPEFAPGADFSNSPPAVTKLAGPPVGINYTADQLVQKICVALSSPNGADHDNVFTNLLLALVRQNARAAAQLAESLDPGPLRGEMLQHLAQIWAAQDVDSALAWAAQLPDVSERNSALGDVLLQWGQSDPGNAIALVGTYGTTYGLDENGNLRANLAQLWAEKDWLAALTWVQANPAAGLQQDQVMERLAFVLAKTSPVEAANFVTAQIPPGFVQTETAMSVLHQWGLQDMAGARAWLTMFPAGDIRQRGEQELEGIAAYANVAN